MFAIPALPYFYNMYKPKQVWCHQTVIASKAMAKQYLTKSLTILQVTKARSVISSRIQHYTSISATNIITLLAAIYGLLDRAGLKQKFITTSVYLSSVI